MNKQRHYRTTDEKLRHFPGATARVFGSPLSGYISVAALVLLMFGQK